MSTSIRNLKENKTLIAYVYIVLGCLIGGAAYPMFLVPNKIAPGGLTGIATVLNFLFQWPVGTVSLILNVSLGTCTILVYIGYILLLDTLDEEDPEYGTKMAKLLKAAQDHGIKTSIDVVSEAGDRFRRLVCPAMRYTDYCVINEVEASASTGIELRTEDGKLLKENMPAALKKMKELGVSTWAVIHCPEIGFGLDENNRIHAANMCPDWQHFDVICDGEFYCHLDMGVLGRHNALNALAAAAAAWMMGIPGEAVSHGLESFHGAGRRMEFKGTFNGAEVYDDYAHHPGELHALLHHAVHLRTEVGHGSRCLRQHITAEHLQSPRHLVAEPGEQTTA